MKITTAIATVISVAIISGAIVAMQYNYVSAQAYTWQELESNQ